MERSEIQDAAAIPDSAALHLGYGAVRIVVCLRSPFDRLRTSGKLHVTPGSPVRAEPFDCAQDRLVEA